MKNKSNLKKHIQLLEISKQIFYFKKISPIEDINLFQIEINKNLSELCIKQHKFLFCKNEIKYLTNSSSSQIDYLIDKHEISISQYNHKKIITLPNFLIYFAIPAILNHHELPPS